jgi:phage-related protein
MTIAPTLSVKFFKTLSGNEPAREWLKSLSSGNKKIIGEDIKLVQFRWPLGMPLVRKMDSDLWEVRSHVEDGNISRVFFTVLDAYVILLHGIIKKSQKAPKKDLDLAISRKKQYFKR